MCRCAGCHGVEVSGLIFLVFCIGAASQQIVGAWSVGRRGNEAILADLAAMHGLAELCGRTEEDPAWANSASDRDKAKSNSLIYVGFCKVALENVPQLVLQSSFFALVFDQLTPVGRAKVLFSILMGLASASQKILEAMMVLVKAISQNEATLNCSKWVFSASFMLAFLPVLWTVAKLYFIFHCESHMWNLGSGCVEWK